MKPSHDIYVQIDNWVFNTKHIVNVVRDADDITCLIVEKTNGDAYVELSSKEERDAVFEGLCEVLDVVRIQKK